MGISPNGYQPKWDGSAQNLTALADAGNDLGAGLAGSMNNVVGGIGQGIMNGLAGIFTGGPFAPAEEAAQEIRNGQMGLENRIDLLFGISGYVFSYMSKNINAEWAFNNTRIMPFDKQLGPSKEAEVSGGKVVLNGIGAWLVMAKVHARGTGYTGSGSIGMTVRIRRPNGEIYHEAIQDNTTTTGAGLFDAPKGPGTILSVFPVVLDEPGCTVEVETWTGAWRWWDGGTRFSMLAAIRHSKDTENAGEETVPDETQP